MADNVDRAGDMDSFLLAAAIEQARVPAERTTSLNFCLDCGDDIPERRRQAVAGCTRCVDCQERRGRR